MKLSEFFIERPIFAAVISTFIVIAGALAMLKLPIGEYPEVVPPSIVVQASYPGANPQVIADTVAAPLEQAIIGVDDMLYMSSTSNMNGTLTLTVTFKIGTDVDRAQVQVQNRVSQASPRLPEEVRDLGVTTVKSSSDLTMLVNLISPDGRYDPLYLRNYAVINVRDVLARLPGMGQVQIFGGGDYAMRIWLDPEKLAVRDLTATDVVNAIREQNVQVAAGQLGAPPGRSGEFEVALNAAGRLTTEQQFRDIIIKTGADGQTIRLGDVARAQLGAQDYGMRSLLDNQSSVALPVFQAPGANALQLSADVRRTMEELKKNFPQGLDYRIAYDPTMFVRHSIDAVLHTLLEAVALVVIVVILFLQTWRASLIPLIAVPVSVIGTFAVLWALGFSINTLSLFGLVLAIGIVVEAAERAESEHRGWGEDRDIGLLNRGQLLIQTCGDGLAAELRRVALVRIVQRKEHDAGAGTLRPTVHRHAGEFHGVRHPGGMQTNLGQAPGVIAAALHRERLIDVVRREREQAAEQRMAELARANAMIRGNLERLARQPDVSSFLGTVLLEATRQFDAAAGMVIVRKDSPPHWEIATHVCGGELSAPPFPTRLPVEGNPLSAYLHDAAEPAYCELDADEECEEWPQLSAYHLRGGHQSMLVFPLLFGAHNVGIIILSFRRRGAEDVARSELLVALAQQATLALEIMRLAHAAKEAAVLMERNRIGREIHDGLAQAFTGILMQLAAADELDPADQRPSSLAMIRTRIRDLASEGLAEARRSVVALRPEQARRGGLELALRQLAERSSVSGRVTCSFEGGAATTGLPPEHDHALLRIAQEAVSNAVRHADPRTVRIALTADNATWVLSVVDDGAGLYDTPENCAAQGFGLTNMRERAEAIGGEWAIDTGAGKGTSVTVRLPHKRAA